MSNTQRKEFAPSLDIALIEENKNPEKGHVP